MMLEDTLENVRDYDWGHSGAPFLELDREIRKVSEHPDQRAALAAKLVEILESDASRAAKRFVCQRLGLIGGEECVPALARMLTKPNVSDMARYALERLLTSRADDALRDALSKADGKAKVGVINSIGARRSVGAASSLGQLLNSTDAAVAEAAAWALGQIADDEAVDVLSAAESEDRAVRRAILDARLACAERLAADNRHADAQAIYKELDADDTPPAIRHAAACGLAKAKA